MKYKHHNKIFNVPDNYSIPKAILDILFHIADGVAPFSSPYQYFIKKRRYQMTGSPEAANWRYNRAIKYLEMREHIRLVKKKDKIFLKLTKKGKLQALLDKIKYDRVPEDPWDGKWRIAIWDIPESSSKARDRIRYFLRHLGFQRLQLSVFIRPHPIPRTAVDYLKESGLIKFIRFLRVDQVDDEHKLLKYYNLQKYKNRHS